MAVLPDIVKPGLDVIFVGTSVSERSSKARHYYSHPRNLFYCDLQHVGFTDRLLKPDEDRELLCYGIGLTDLAKETVSSDDRALSGDDYDPDRLADVIRTNRPRVVCFNGKTAYRKWRGSRAPNWGLQTRETIDGAPIFVVPSTSGRWPEREKLDGRTRREWFQDLKDWLSGRGEGPRQAGSTQERGEEEMRNASFDICVEAIVRDIITIFQSEGRAPYLKSDGWLHFVCRTSNYLEVRRRRDNPEPWKVPIDALVQAVRESCDIGRSLRASKCKEICNRRGTPISILLRLVPESRYVDCRRRRPTGRDAAE
jgi:TDG/mug DNA glycosylase family protein